MAQLKDLVVNGDARIVGTLYAGQGLPDGVFHLANISGTAAVTTSPYSSSKWQTTVNDPRITSLYSGLTISLKIPVAGHSTYGTMLDVNGLGYHPVVYNVNSNISTRYSVGGTIILTYNATQTANGYDATASATSYTGCWQLEDYDYDSTNIYQLRDNNAQITIDSNAGALYRYELIFMNKSGKGVPYNNQSNKTTTYNKTLNSAAFDPFLPIYYYSSTTTVNAGSNAGANTLYYHVSFDCRYSMNIQSDGTEGSTALTAHRPVYIVATYDDTTGTATLVNNTSATSYLDRSSIIQELPASNLSGKILIYLGRAYSKYQIELSPTHPVYKWDAKNSVWAEFTGTASTVNGHSIFADVPSDAKFTDNNTTYTFTGGTNKFTVTPSSGTASDVTITPSISNNITGSGTRTSGYLAKFSGTNTITNGPQLGSATTTFLRNDASWVNPQNVYVGSSAPSGDNYQVWIDTNGAVDKTAIVNAVYPVGSIYISTSNTNPGTLLGVGTWSAFGTGRTLVGVDTSQTEFNTVEKTGGHKALQQHTHTMQNAGSHGHNNACVATWGWLEDCTGFRVGDHIAGYSMNSLPADGSHKHTIDNAGSGNAGNLQPYITVYMWKRTA